MREEGAIVGVGPAGGAALVAVVPRRHAIAVVIRIGVVADPVAVEALEPRYRELHMRLRRDASREAAAAVGELLDPEHGLHQRPGQALSGGQDHRAVPDPAGEDDDELGDPDPGLRQVGAIVEHPTFYPYLSARDNLRVLGGVHGEVPAPRIDEVFVLVGLQDRRHDKFETFSLGMKQRLGLAGALLHEPALLILDEPTNGLDPAGIVEMRALILRLAREGYTILLCSHLLAEVQQVCDRVLILSNGRALVQGNVTDLLRQGAQTALRVDDPQRAEALLRSIPWIEHLTRDYDTLLLTMDEGYLSELNRTLAQNDLVVLELGRRERNLEQFFLTITGDAPGR